MTATSSTGRSRAYDVYGALNSMIELLLALLLTQSQPRIITCVVTGPQPDHSVICPKIPPEGKTVGSIYILKHWPKEKWDEWKWRAPMADGGVHPDGKLYKVRLKSRDTVKAQIIDGELFPVADCDVRVWRNMQEWLRDRRGERMPIGLWTQPDDCQPWYEKQ